VKTILATTLSGAVMLATVAPAAAQDYRFTDSFAPQRDEVTATLNYRVPLGPTRQRPSYGLTINASRADDAMEMADGTTWRPQRGLADIRFDEDGLAQAQFGGLDFAPRALAWGEDGKDGKDGKDPKEWGAATWIIVGLVVVVVAVAVANDDDDDNHDGPSAS